jgi:hypothetical protein
MKRAMFDIETLSTFPTAAVIAIGVVIRDDDNLSHRQARSWFIDRDFVTGTEDRATLEWWNDQDERVRSQVFGGNQTPREVFQELNGFLKSNGIHANDGGDGYRCYASPAMFDFPILRHQYQQLGLLPAWHWRSERCLSTLKKEIRDNFSIEIADITPELAHHPVHDCLAQFQELDACFSELRGLRDSRFR